MDVEGLLAGLNPDQQRAVTSPISPLCIRAGAGSGKTRVLTRRIAWRSLTGDADPRHVLALTFTRKAAGELSSRLRAFGLRDVPAAGTFHATAWAQLRTWWDGGDRRPPTLLEHKARVLRTVVERRDRLTVAELASEIEWAKARLVTPEAYGPAAVAAGRRVTAAPNLVADRYARYELEKQRKGLVDFDDLLARCADAFETDRAFADAQRWRFRHLLVDEYQDVNPLQQRLVRAWLGDGDDLCVVGDPNQAIYRWNGADAGYLTRFTDHFPGAEVLDLVDNYRSTPQVLAVASAVLDGGGSGRRPLRANRADGPVPAVIDYDTEVDEANGVARALRDHHGPSTRWSSQAVLVRTNAQTVAIAQALRLARIPYRVRGGSGLADDGWTRALLRAACPDARTPFAAALADLEALLVDAGQVDAGQVDTGRVAGPVTGATGHGDRPIGAPVAPARGRPARGPGGGQASARERSGRTDRLGPVELPRPMDDEQRSSLAAVVALGREFLPLDPRAGTSAFPAWLAASMRSEGAEAGSDAVDLVSFHAAKGLEWEVVHVAGLEQGFVPISHARGDHEAEAEERRLLYVALTRARRELRLTWAAQRSFGERVVDRSPSPWLATIAAAAAELRRAGVPVSTPRGLDRARARLGPAGAVGGSPTPSPSLPPAPDDPDSELFAALVAWRARVARGAAVTPPVVLADRTLAAIARQRPSHGDDLTGVPGLGPVRRRQHGDTLLAIVAAHPPVPISQEARCGSS